MWYRYNTRSGFARTMLACVIGTSLTASAQVQRPVDRQKPDSVVVNAADVLLDAVVRDKRGRQVQDLTAADVEVYEDGVKQEINSFRFVSPKSVDSNPLTTKSGEPGRQTDRQSSGRLGGSDTSTGPSAIALVFDRLSPEARTSAYKAALSYVDVSASNGELLGVFITDLSVSVLQPLTLDHALVKAGIQKAGLHSSSLYQSTNEEARGVRRILTNGLNTYQDPTASRDGLPPPNTAPSLTSAGAMAALQLGMLERAEEDQRDELGNVTARGLLDVTSSLRALPGRKAIIFFSEGLILPSSVMQTFPALINAANRNNVSFYTVDAAGLRAESKTLETSKEIDSRSQFRMAQLATDADSDGPMTKGLERNEDLLRLNPDSGLGRLANETGGFLITDSNDLTGKLQKVDEDLHAYYQLSYRSNNQNYDGHFRKIEVRVKRSGVDVQSRKGYFAIRNAFNSPVLSYEAPALASLENQPTANLFPFYASGFNFPERETIGLTPLIADLPLSAFTFTVDQEKQVYNTDFSVVAVLKDQNGQVVEKRSKQYRLSGPADKLEDDKKGRVLFYREADLPPGRYGFETIAYDAPTGRSSVRTGTIEVTGSDEAKLRLSDVVILNGAEPASPADAKRSNPFHVGSVLVNPNLGQPIHRTLKELPFYFTVYLPAETSPLPKMTIELRQQDHTLAQMAADPPKPDASGRIQYFAGLPMEKVPAGSYELRITVTDGTLTVTRSRHFTLTD